MKNYKVRSCALFLMAFLGTASASHAMTYSAWSERPTNEKTIYTFGVFHAAGVYAQSLGYADQWDDCLDRIDFGQGNFFRTLDSFIDGRRDLATLTPAAVLILYANDTCGLLPDGIPQNR